jgi:hypothetical protein
MITFAQIAHGVANAFTEAFAQSYHAILLRAFYRHDKQIFDTIIRSEDKCLMTKLVRSRIANRLAMCTYLPSHYQSTPQVYHLFPWPQLLAV